MKALPFYISFAPPYLAQEADRSANLFHSNLAVDVWISFISLILTFLVLALYHFLVRKIYKDEGKYEPKKLFKFAGGWSLVLAVIAFLLSIINIWFENLLDPGKGLIIILVSLLSLAIINCDWLVLHADILRRLPHNQVINTLIQGSNKKEDLLAISPLFFEISIGFANHLGMLNKDDNPERKKILLNALSDIYFDKILVEFESDDNLPGYIRFSLETNNYIKFLECLFRNLDSSHEINVYSLYQPYEWFHNLAGEAQITLFDETVQYMNFCRDYFKPSNGKRRKCHLKRYIITNKQVLKNQKNLYIYTEDGEPKAYPLDNPLVKDNRNAIFTSVYPFEKSNPDLLNNYPADKKIFIICEYDKKALFKHATSSNWESLFNIFQFGHTCMLYREWAPKVIELKGGPTNRECVFFGSELKEIHDNMMNKLKSKCRLVTIEEITLVGNKNGPIFAYFVDIRPDHLPDTVVLILDDDLLQNLKVFFGKLGEVKCVQTLGA